jgi:type VI secretion system protein ImpA
MISQVPSEAAMPTPATLDIDALLKPIPGSDPAGVPLPYEDRVKLDEYRTDFDPERDLADLSPDDPQRRDAKKIVPNWKGVITLTTKALTNTGKDLAAVTRLVEALAHAHGFAGLRDGLALLRKLFQECADRMHPVVKEPDDLETRAGRVGWLDEPSRNINFPLAIRGISFFLANGVAVSFNHTQPSGNNPPLLNNDDFRTACRTAPPATFERIAILQEDITEALNELTELVSVLGVALAEYAPSMNGIRGALEDCARLAGEIQRNKPSGENSAEPPPIDETATGGATVASGTGMSLGAIRNREDAYKRLEELADILEKLDPHSPVPFLIRRAVEMRSYGFPLLVDNLTKPGTVLDFLRTQLPKPE